MFRMKDERDRESVSIGIDPFPMEEVSKEIAQEDNGGTDDYLNEEFEVSTCKKYPLISDKIYMYIYITIIIIVVVVVVVVDVVGRL